jgi:putative copper export protein
MENLPPEAQRTNALPTLDYARPSEKLPERTPFYVRVIGLGFSILALFLGILLGVLAVAIAVEQIRRYRKIVETDVVRLFLASLILLVSGTAGIYCARRFGR